MAGQAGYKVKLQISTDAGTTWLDVPATSPTMEIAGDVLDTTELKTNAGFRTRINGLHDFSVNADSNYIKNDPALVALRTAKLSRAEDTLVRFLPDGADETDGIQGTVIVETFNIQSGVGDLLTVSISLQGNSAITILTP